METADLKLISESISEEGALLTTFLLNLWNDDLNLVNHAIQLVQEEYFVKLVTLLYSTTTALSELYWPDKWSKLEVDNYSAVYMKNLLDMMVHIVKSEKGLQFSLLVDEVGHYIYTIPHFMLKKDNDSGQTFCLSEDASWIVKRQMEILNAMCYHPLGVKLLQGNLLIYVLMIKILDWKGCDEEMRLGAHFVLRMITYEDASPELWELVSITITTNKNLQDYLAGRTDEHAKEFLSHMKLITEGKDRDCDCKNIPEYQKNTHHLKELFIRYKQPMPQNNK